ncbi:MAG: hypothetical protein F4X82_00535 [Candidatus Spechtbacteria bacterium SB0662_bin_43]|uniref:Uncharacterized protein n=1 Tax=Candidatus Spechtbacteria bacterium SB0662_bin_43 TaxID=2604897 RepID=A0A845D9D7_9BACT|nr:hypothetical protein [Candidatus Spechtbacteria bacterium SB0662_bin_43]
MKRQSVYKTKILTGIMLCIVMLATMSLPATAQTANVTFRQTQYHYVDLASPTLGKNIPAYSPRSFINHFNRVDTQHIFGSLYSSTISTENTVKHYTYLVVANLGTLPRTLSYVDNVEAKLYTSQVLGIDLPLQEIKYLSNRVCHLPRSPVARNPHSMIASKNCEKISKTRNIVIRPGQFLLKVYSTPGRYTDITPKAIDKSPFLKNQSFTIKNSDVIITKADIRMREIGYPARLTSLVSIGNVPSASISTPQWTYAPVVNGKIISFSDNITPLQLLSSLQWLR